MSEREQKLIAVVLRWYEAELRMLSPKGDFTTMVAAVAADGELRDAVVEYMATTGLPEHEMDDCKSCQVMSCEHCGSTDIDAACTGPKVT